MRQFRLLACASALAVLTAGSAIAEKPFEGVELKLLGIGDTSVTRLAPIVGEFEELTGAKGQIDTFPYPGLIDKIIIEASSDTPSYQLLWVDSPEEVYARPRNTFDAIFIGSPAMNLVNARVMGGRLQVEAFARPVPDRFSGSLQEGQAVQIGIRPSGVALFPDGLPAAVQVTEFLSEDALLDLRQGPHELIA